MTRVVVGETILSVEIDRAKAAAALLQVKSATVRHPSLVSNSPLRLTKRFQIVRRGGEVRVIQAGSDSCRDAIPIPSIIKAVARARDWYDRLIAGKVATIAELGQQSGFGGTYARRILRCVNLSPEITETLLAGRHRPNLTLKQLLNEMPLDWQVQKSLI